MEIEIEIGLTRAELAVDVQIACLVKVAEQMIDICGETPREAIVALLAAATVTAIRNAPSGTGVAPELKDLMLEAMKIARRLTTPPPWIKQ